jgi:hypothetical protein
MHFGTQWPAGGAARKSALKAVGRQELFAAKSCIAKARSEAGCLVQHKLQAPHAPWWMYPPTAAVVASCAMKPRRWAGESNARDALRFAANAINLLEDTQDEDDAHRLVHEIGAFVSWHYGCKIILEDGQWNWTCPVTLAHLRVGYSVGFTATRICSICREDISECPHLPNRLYQVRVDDRRSCPCGTFDCQKHEEGEVIETSPSAIIENADLQEISLVARPRDPLARILTIGFTSEKMSKIIGGKTIPETVTEMGCFHCRQACTGLWDGIEIGEFLTRSALS